MVREERIGFGRSCRRSALIRTARPADGLVALLAGRDGDAAEMRGYSLPRSGEIGSAISGG